MAVGLVVGVGFDPSPTDFQELIDRGLIDQLGFEYVTLELSAEDAQDRKQLGSLYQAACVKQGWEDGAFLHSESLAFAEVVVAGRTAIVVRPEGSARSWLQQDADTGDAGAMLNLGVMAAEDGDRDSARNWYQRAAGAGDGQAMFNLGVMSHEDDDRTAARAWWQRAADTGSGHTQAMFNLGVMADEDGDRDAARGWLQRAADAGDDNARAALLTY